MADYAILYQTGRVQVLHGCSSVELREVLEGAGDNAWVGCVPFQWFSEADRGSTATHVILVDSREALGFTGTRAEAVVAFLERSEDVVPRYSVFPVEPPGPVTLPVPFQSEFNPDICFVCGASRVSTMGSHYGFVANFTSGYESPVLPDGLEIAFCVCEPCAAAWMRTFSIPPFAHTIWGDSNAP